MIIGLTCWALGAGLALITVGGTCVLALCAAKDAHDAEYGLGRHRDDLVTPLSTQPTAAPSDAWTPTPTRLAALLPTPVAARA